MKYVSNKYKGQNSCLEYANIDEEICRLFVQSHECEAWLVSEVT